jgi:GNAT superfamily N-acetyltransferase
MIEIAPLHSDDRAEWEVLARGYKEFYETVVSDAGYEEAWRRLLAQDGIHGFAAKLDGRLVGITHYLFHTTVWLGEYCYLQDLFVDPEVRGRGVARALIERVADIARERDCARLYWGTRQNNDRARALYDKVAIFRGFIIYDYPHFRS